MAQQIIHVDIHLEDDEADRLRRLSALEGRPVADVLQEALREYLARWGETAERQPGAVIPPRRRIPDEEWQANFDTVLNRVRANVAEDPNTENIETEITLAREEVRQERTARRRAQGG